MIKTLGFQILIILLIALPGFAGAPETPASSNGENIVSSGFDESQINYKNDDETKTPIWNEKKTKVEEQSSSLYQTLLTILVLLFLGSLGFWYLKRKALLGNNQKGLMQIKVLTQYHLAPKKSLLVVRVAGESLLLGLTDNNINLLKSLSLLDEDVPAQTPKDFKETISKAEALADLNMPPKNTILKNGTTGGEKSHSEAIAKSESAEEVEDYSLGNIRDMVEIKLKDLKRW